MWVPLYEMLFHPLTAWQASRLPSVSMELFQKSLPWLTYWNPTLHTRTHSQSLAQFLAVTVFLSTMLRILNCIVRALRKQWKILSGEVLGCDYIFPRSFWQQCEKWIVEIEVWVSTGSKDPISRLAGYCPEDRWWCLWRWKGLDGLGSHFEGRNGLHIKCERWKKEKPRLGPWSLAGGGKCMKHPFIEMGKPEEEQVWGNKG